MAVLELPENSAGGRPPSAGFGSARDHSRRASNPELELGDYAVVVLANVSGNHLTPAVVEALERHVASGGGLILSAGDRVTGESARFAWNEKLYRPDGSGLLPAELTRHVSITSRREGYFRVRDFDATHPVLAFFSDDLWKPLLTELPFYEFLACQPLADAKVLVRLDDEAESPLLVERAYDQGRVFLWTSTLDAAWTLLPELRARTSRSLVH
jgi:uncharacterized membrane protein